MSEAPVGIEPTMRDLQSRALPLGYGAELSKPLLFQHLQTCTKVARNLGQDRCQDRCQEAGAAADEDALLHPGIEVRDGGSQDAEWRLRTFERGVEAETLACGTGTVGAAVALAARGLARLPVRIASWGGNIFSVAATVEGGEAREPWLCGEGRLVFEGVVEAPK